MKETSVVVCVEDEQVLHAAQHVRVRREGGHANDLAAEHSALQRVGIDALPRLKTRGVGGGRLRELGLQAVDVAALLGVLDQLDRGLGALLPGHRQQARGEERVLLASGQHADQRIFPIAFDLRDLAQPVLEDLLVPMHGPFVPLNLCLILDGTEGADPSVTTLTARLAQVANQAVHLLEDRTAVGALSWAGEVLYELAA